MVFTSLSLNPGSNSRMRSANACAAAEIFGALGDGMGVGIGATGGGAALTDFAAAAAAPNVATAARNRLRDATNPPL